jgi:hypothetical protein
MRARDTSEASHRAQLGVYRRMGPSRRVALAADLSAAARELTRSGIRSRNPAYSDADVESALLLLLYGDDLFRRAWPNRPRLAP